MNGLIAELKEKYYCNEIKWCIIYKNINIMEKFFMQMELQRLRLDDI
jgi:hypothetical protein